MFAVCRALGDLSGPHFDAARLSMLSSMCQHGSHAINPRLCSKKGGGHKNVRESKTLGWVSQPKRARKQNTGISTRKLALWPRK